MKSSDMLKMLTGKDGNLLTDVKAITEALEKMKKREKSESARRRIEADRRKQFGKVGVNAKLSYDAMTSFVWEYSMNHLDDLRTWMQYEYPDKFARTPGEIQGDVEETTYEGIVDAQE